MGVRLFISARIKKILVEYHVLEFLSIQTYECIADNKRTRSSIE